MNYPIYTHTNKAYSLSKIEYPDYMEEIGRLRYLAWKDVPGINADLFSKGFWIDDQDTCADIWVIQFENKIVASARLSIHHTLADIPWHECIPANARAKLKTPAASMNRLCVLPEFRKLNLSKKLDSVRLNAAKEKKVKTIIAEPILSRFSTFEKYGFQYYGMFGQTQELPGVQLGFWMLIL